MTTSTDTTQLQTKVYHGSDGHDGFAVTSTIV